MKRILIVLFCGLALAGCSSEDTRTVDEKFIDALEEGLSARWELTDLNLEDSTENFNSYVDAELNKISEFKDEGFENKNLKKAADAYIQSLEDTKSITGDLDKNSSRFYEEYQPVYSERIMALKSINDESELTFQKETDQKEFESILDEANVIEAVQSLYSKFDFKKTDEDSQEEYGFYSATLESKVKNDTDYKFEFFNLTINVLDAEGTVLTQTYASAAPWNIDETRKFEIYVGEKFDTVKITKIEYQLANDGTYGTLYIE